MVERHNKATINRPAGDRAIDAPLLLINLPRHINQLKSEKAWQAGDRNSITLFKTDKIRVVLVAMREGAEMHTLQPNNILMVQVIEGRMQLVIKQKTLEITKEGMLALHEQIPYIFQALEKTTFLLTLAE